MEPGGRPRRPTPSERVNHGSAGVTHGVCESSVRRAVEALGAARTCHRRHRGAPRAARRGERGRAWLWRARRGRPGPAHRHGERLEGALPWAGAVHVGARAVPPLRRGHRGAGRRFAGRGPHAVSRRWFGARRALPGRRRRRRRPRPDDRRPPRGDRAPGQGLGGRRLDPGRAVRDHRLPQGRAGLRDHDAPGRGLRARVAQARGDLRRRHRGRPLAARLHHQRDGPAAARHGADRPLRRAGRPGGRAACAPRSTPRSRSPTTRCACCAPARFAARFALEPDPALVAAVERMHGGSPSSRPSASATSWTRWSWSTCRPVRCGSWCAPAWPRSSSPSSRPGARTRPDPPPQGRAGPHAGRGRQDLDGPGAPPGRALPRRGQAADAGHHRRRGELPPPRGRGRRA